MDGAKGPNTGGMGTVCPLDDVSEETMIQFEKDIMAPTLEGLIKEKFDYRGFIFFGVMLTKQGPKLLEYNVRLGDPETQAVLPLMDFDFAAMCTAILNGSLKDFNFEWKPGYQVAPVVVSGGYPGDYKKGLEITFNEAILNASTAKVFVAGAVSGRRGAGDMLTSGGRVLACSAYGDTFKEAWEKAYQGISAVKFEGAFYRKDIGLPGAAESGKL
jgi:phosphoribosylamine--glycine ligase